jgi:5-methylcytosine-specific restriction protein A
VCDFNFEAKYGEIGSGFIHVHHLTPLANIGKEYEVDSIRDLRPVCPNCHAMLHKKYPPYSIEELKSICK